LVDCEFRTTDIPNNNRARRIFACDPESACAAVVAGPASDNWQVQEEEAVVIRR
jgi:hypothetical protein